MLQKAFIKMASLQSVKHQTLVIKQTMLNRLTALAFIVQKQRQYEMSQMLAKWYRTTRHTNKSPVRSLSISKELALRKEEYKKKYARLMELRLKPGKSVDKSHLIAKFEREN